MALEYQIWNRGNSYYDDVLAQLMFQAQYPYGTTERKKVDGEWMDVPITPEYLGPNARKRVRMDASLKEDEALRGALGYSRGRGKGEPEGSYVTTKYPGIEHQIWAQESGFLPRGISWRSLLNESPQERMMRERKQREWAQYQRRLLGGR